LRGGWVETLGHLEDVGMGYFEHMKWAFTLSIRFGLSSIQLIIHSIFPFLFINAGKNAADYYYSINKSR
jgi:hypothetical protein